MSMRSKKLQGSVLVFSLLVLALLLSAALSAAAVVVSGQRSSLATKKSMPAFQIAEGAAENVLRRIYNFDNVRNSLEDDTIDDLVKELFGQGPDGSGKPSCSERTISGRLPSSEGTYTVTFFNGDTPPVAISCSSTAWRTDVVYIKAVGVYNGTVRAIAAAIRPLP